MNVIELVSASGGLVVAIVGAITYISAQRANKAQAAAATRQVDADAYLRAKEIYEAALDTMRKELEALRAELREARADIRELRHSNDKLREELVVVKTELARYEAAGR